MVKLSEMGFGMDHDKGLDFDVRDDLIVYMRNDPGFYRQHYYPKMAEMCDGYRKKKKLKKESLSSLVDQAIPMYMRKYKINRKPNEVFTDEDRASIIEMIFAEEEAELRKGEY